MLDLTKKFKLNEKIVLRKIESKCWALNVENVIEIVGKEYAVDKERLIADCCLMIQTAVDKNILKEV